MTLFSKLTYKGMLKQATAQGPGIADDTALVVTGNVLQVDSIAGRVLVGIRDGEVWLPAVAGRYSPSSLARVLFDPTSARPVLVEGPVQPRKPAELGTVTATGGGTVTVTIGGESIDLPAPLGTYTVGQSAWVLLDDWGHPVLALGPSTTPAPDAPGTGGGGGGGGTVVATATITPRVSGTYRTGYGWDSWNTSRYGGKSDVYQGNSFGSGQLIGYAGYGDQLANLGAISIDEAIITARKNDTNGLSAALTVQGTAPGTRPAGSPAAGPFAAATTPVIGPGGTGSVALPGSLCEAFRTGAAKGLVAVGTQYGGFGGTATPGSLVLTVRYTKNA